MRVYKFINTHYGLQAINDQRIKISRIGALNDPFEGLSYQTDHYFSNFILKRRRKNFIKRWGILCFSRNYTSPAQWAHYADVHRGLCLGFDILDRNLIQVEYITQRAGLGEFKSSLAHKDINFLKHILSQKYDHWAYEEEHRMLQNLGAKKKADELCFADFSSNFELKELIFGARFCEDKKIVRELLKKLDVPVETFSVIPCKKEFAMIKDCHR